MAKSRDAFRTISEVSEILDTPAHVLRFWESKFKQIKPVKRAGGRRYYRPDDLALLAAIKDLLHEQGHSIKNAQKLIRDSGVKQVVADGHALLGTLADGPEAADPIVAAPKVAAVPEDGQIDLFAADTPDTAVPADVEVDHSAPEPEDASSDNIFAAQEAVAAIVQDETPPLETKSAAPAPIVLPAPPTLREAMPPRVLAAIMAADSTRIKANAAKIAPVYGRLSALRDELHHPW